MSGKFLFVYGTLMRGSQRAMAKRLRQQARFVGQASMPGRLYALGSYPGAVVSEGPREKIHGEVFEISGAPAALLDQLDRYESCAEGQPRPHPYERVVAKVRLANGRDLMALTYLYRLPVAHLRPIPGGRWRGKPSGFRH